MQINNLWARGCAFLGTETAILGGAMSWVSERNLVAAISNAGGFGVIACSSMSPSLLEAEIKATRENTNKPFGVNIIIMHPQLDELLGVCIEQKVSHVVLAGGIPSSVHIQRLKNVGIKTIGFAPALIIAKKLIRDGIDALIIEGMEAGGHIGPVSTSVLVQEIIPPLINSVPIFVAGGIGRGDMIAAYLQLGASGCQLGTRFVCASESIAHPAFKHAFIKAQARDAVASVQLDPDFPVIPVRALKNKATEAFARAQMEAISEFRTGKIDKKEAQLKIEHFWAGALRKAVIDGDIDAGSLMAGQSVGMVNKEQPCAEIIAELLQEAEDYLQQG